MHNIESINSAFVVEELIKLRNYPTTVQLMAMHAKDQLEEMQIQCNAKLIISVFN
jgi:hypothetical protein